MTPNPVPFVVISAAIISLIFFAVSPLTTVIVVGAIILLMFIFAPAWAFFNIVVTPIYFVLAWSYKIIAGIIQILAPRTRKYMGQTNIKAELRKIGRWIESIFR